MVTENETRRRIEEGALTTVYATMEPCENHPGFNALTGFHLVKPENWVYSYVVADPSAFIAHMRLYHSVIGGALSREDYEALCAKVSIKPRSDLDLDDYGMRYGDFGMDHYHVEEENREAGIASTVHQRRWRGIDAELKAARKVKPIHQATLDNGKKVDEVRCSCGCIVPRSLVMNANFGTACPDCYDRLS